MRIASLAVLGIVLAGCGTSVQPTAVSLPPTSAVFSTVVASPTGIAAERIWKQQAVGSQQITVTFYSNAGGAPCLRYQVADGAPVEKCATTNNLVAVQGTTTDSDGTVYTIVAGRILSDQITAVSLEMANGSNTPAEVDDGGFVTVLPGQNRFVRAVPIDQYGNLVGQIITFN